MSIPKVDIPIGTIAAIQNLQKNDVRVLESFNARFVEGCKYYQRKYDALLGDICILKML